MYQSWHANLPVMYLKEFLAKAVVLKSNQSQTLSHLHPIKPSFQGFHLNCKRTNFFFAGNTQIVPNSFIATFIPSKFLSLAPDPPFQAFPILVSRVLEGREKQQKHKRMISFSLKISFLIYIFVTVLGPIQTSYKNKKKLKIGQNIYKIDS